MREKTIIIEKLTTWKNLIFCQRFFANANRHFYFFSNTKKPTQKKQKSLFSTVLWKIASLILILLITACAPQSKESYLKDYKEFISDVNKESNSYSKQDWEKADEKFEKYNGEWHEKFEDEFTWKEDIKITKYQFQYNLTKIKRNSNDFFNTFKRDDYQQLKEQIKYYSENDMNEDIEYILEQAKDYGESATETVEEILKELDIKIDKLQDE